MTELEARTAPPRDPATGDSLWGPVEPSVPRYGEASLADLGPSLLAALGLPGTPNVLGVEPAERICLFLVDALGWEQLRAHVRLAPFLGSLLTGARSLTSGFASTTSASMASIGTGLPPGEHGLLGYTVALPGLETPLNTLAWSLVGPVAGPPGQLLERVPPEHVQAQPTLAERAAAAGIAFTFAGPAAHELSGLTRAVLRGGTYRPMGPLDQDAEKPAEALVHARSFVAVYETELDTAGHRDGAASEAWREQLGRIDGLARRIAESLPSGSLFVVTGDHGTIDLRPEGMLDLADHPDLRAGVRMLAGEPRARHVHARAGAADDVLASWRAILGERAWVASRDETIQAGWFGPSVADAVRPRIGDVVAAMRAPIGVFDASVWPREHRMVGHHGSMTTREQLVPFLSLRT